MQFPQCIAYSGVVPTIHTIPCDLRFRVCFKHAVFQEFWGVWHKCIAELADLSNYGVQCVTQLWNYYAHSALVETDNFDAGLQHEFQTHTVSLMTHSNHTFGTSTATAKGSLSPLDLAETNEGCLCTFKQTSCSAISG